MTGIKTSDMNHLCIQQMSYLFLFSPSGFQSSKRRIFIVTFYDRSFSSAAASLLLRPFSPFSSSFCIIVLPCANCPLFLVPRYFSSFLLPLYFLIFPIVILLVLLWNCTIKGGHFVSSKKDRTQILRKSEPFARRQEKEKFDGDVFYLSLTFGGLGVACWLLVTKFAGSNPAEADEFLGRKNPQHAFLRGGSKAVGPMS